MSTVSNPLYKDLIPGGMNPTGNQISISGSVPGAKGGANDFLPMSATSLSSSGPVSGNPFAGGAVPGLPGTPFTAQTPTPGINAGGFTSSGGALLPGGGGTNATGGSASDPFGMGRMTAKDGARLFKSLKMTYGDGMAHMILDFLQSGAGYNQQAINNLLASLQPGIERGQENLMEQFSVSGNRFGSGAQIGLADYLSQVNLNEGQLITQMYEKALDNFMNVMMGTSSQHAELEAGKPSIWDQISGGMGMLQNAGGKALGALGLG